VVSVTSAEGGLLRDAPPEVGAILPIGTPWEDGAFHGEVQTSRRTVRGFLLAAVRRPTLTLSVLVLIVVVLWAIVPGLFTSYNPLNGTPSQALAPPSAAHWFGTDYIGRDLFSRVIYGTRLSLEASLLAVGTALVIGTFFGLVSGFAGGVVDDIVMRIVDVVLAIPALLLSLVFITALGYGTIEVAVAVGLASFAAFARVMRAEVLRSKSATYVEAARVIGAKRPRIAFRHILPNSVQSVIALAALEFGTSILAIAALSFLGFGAAPPAPEWGSLVADGRNYMDQAWWLIFFPGVVVAVTVLAVNRCARAIKV
jgi:peptide/nickel transport system permease protein